MDAKKEIEKIKQILSDEKFVYRDKEFTANLTAIVTDKKNKALNNKPVSFMMLHGESADGEKVSVWSYNARVADKNAEAVEPVVEEVPEPVIEETPEGGFPDEDDISEPSEPKPKKVKKPKKAKEQ